MAQVGQMVLHVFVLEDGCATAATLGLGQLDLPFDCSEAGGLDLRDHRPLVAAALRDAADRLIAEQERR